MEKLDGVAAHHSAFFVFGYAGEILVDDFQRLGPVGLLMGKVGAPHQPVDVDLVAQLDTDPVKLKAPQAVLANVFTGQMAERLEAEQALGPAMVAVVANVGALQKEWNPADLILGE